MPEQPQPDSTARSEQGGPNLSGHLVVRFTELPKEGNEVLIEHDGQIYRLRLTKNGKLILNK